MSLPPSRARQDVLHESPWARWVARPMPDSDERYFCCELFDYSTIVPFLPNGNTLVVEQYRPAVRSHSLEWPGGLVDSELDPKQTALAELNEETGWIAESCQSLGSFHSDSGRLDNQCHIFVCQALKRSQPWSPESGLAVIEKSPAEIEADIANGSFRNAIHVLAWHLAKGHAQANSAS